MFLHWKVDFLLLCHNSSPKSSKYILVNANVESSDVQVLHASIVNTFSCIQGNDNEF